MNNHAIGVLTEGFASRFRMCIAALSCLAMISACKPTSESSRSDANQTERPDSPAARKLPICGQVMAQAINYLEVWFVDAQAFVVNDKDKGQRLHGACRNHSYGFNRYLMQDGAWVNEEVMLKMVSNSGDQIVELAHVSVLTVTDRSHRYAYTNVSAIGQSSSKSNGHFSKWFASNEQIKAFNERNPANPIFEKSAWSINETTDDVTKGPASINCTAASSSEDVDYLLYNATADGHGSSNTSATKRNCNINFSVDFGKTQRAIVKIQFGGQLGHAKLAVENTRKEIIERFKDAAK
jgi:hypothetical protein